MPRESKGERENERYRKKQKEDDIDKKGKKKVPREEKQTTVRILFYQNLFYIA